MVGRPGGLAAAVAAARPCAPRGLPLFSPSCIPPACPLSGVAAPPAERQAAVSYLGWLVAARGCSPPCGIAAITSPHLTFKPSAAPADLVPLLDHVHGAVFRRGRRVGLLRLLCLWLVAALAQGLWHGRRPPHAAAQPLSAPARLLRMLLLLLLSCWRTSTPAPTLPGFSLPCLPPGDKLFKQGEIPVWPDIWEQMKVRGGCCGVRWLSRIAAGRQRRSGVQGVTKDGIWRTEARHGA